MTKDNNYNRLLFAKQLEEYRRIEFGLSGNFDSQKYKKLSSQLLIDCMMDDYSDINFHDPAIEGLFEILHIPYSSVFNMTVLELSWKMLEVFETFSFTGAAFSPAVSKIFEASLMPNGLKYINQLYKYLGQGEIDLSAKPSDIAIDEREKERVMGNAYSLSVLIQVDDTSEMDSDYAIIEKTETDIYVTTDLKSLLIDGQENLNKLLERYSIKSNGNHKRYLYEIHCIDVLLNGSAALRMDVYQSIKRDRVISINLLENINKFELMSGGKGFLDELLSLPGITSAKNIFKAKALEFSLGL
jgi:hypothetical protein